MVKTFLRELIYDEIYKKEVGKYRTEEGKLKEVEKYKIHIYSRSSEDICTIYIYDIITTGPEGNKFIEYPSNEIRIEIENTLSDEYSVFMTKSYCGKGTENNLLEIELVIYKKDNFVSNKNMYALGAIKIDSEGEIRYETN